MNNATQSKIARHQILIVEIMRFDKECDRMALRDSILEQMKDGVVVLPNYAKAQVLDADTVVFKNEQGGLVLM